MGVEISTNMCIAEKSKLRVIINYPRASSKIQSSRLPCGCQGCFSTLQSYTLKVTYKPGKELHIADALGRSYLQEQKEDFLGEELEVSWVTPQLPISEEKLNMFRKATADGPEMQMLRDTTING